MRVHGATACDLEDVYRLRYRQFLHVTTAITGDEDAGHDAVQEGFAAALRHRDAFRGDGPLEAWVWRAVINAARKMHTSRGRSVALAESTTAANGGAPADETGIRTWIAGLPERQRLAVFLRYYGDLDYRSIASALDVEVGTVSATLSAAHSALRKQLREVTR
ncbi:MAG: RNA polymerase sigma factor [Gaiellaceae bacterium]